MASGTVPQSETARDATPAPLSAARAWRLYAAAAVYALLVALTAWRHEPWADEAQGWLLGRDAGLGALWGRLLHYEGSPGLWQTLVHALIHLGLPYSAYNFVSAILGFTAVYLLLRYSPLPLYLRLLLPFTYYLCYQYAIIARSYALVAPLLFAIALLYTRPAQKAILLTLLLCLLAAVSVHGFVLSASIWVALATSILRTRRDLQPRELRALVLSGVTYWLALAFLALSAWPAEDVAFAQNRGLANLRLETLWPVIQRNLGGAFTGYWATALVVIALSLPFLWRGGGWVFFSLASAGLCLFGAIVYTQVWHFGILFLAWLFAIWISAYKARVTKPVIVAVTAVLVVQSYWTVQAVSYDWSHAYSGSSAAAAYLRQKGLPPGGVYAVGYSSTALQPYFPTNIYSDFQDAGGGGAGHGYWDWSERNTANEATALIASTRRDLVLVGYTKAFDKEHWGALLPLLGYQLEHRFDGSTFWQSGVFESESFEIYRKTAAVRAASAIEMGDGTRAAQLLSGFYGIEAGNWRWTAKEFSVLLMAPPGSGQRGAELTLKLFLPAQQLQRLGAITLDAEVDRHALAARTYAEPAAFEYVAHVPAEALRPGFVVVNFRLNKAAAHLGNGDQRELGVIVTAVGLTPTP